MTDQFKVEENIEIPPANGSTGGGGRPLKYPWPEMNIGSSFFVPGLSPNQMRPVGFRWSQTNTDGKWKFVFRAVREPNSQGVEVEGTRVWRVEDAE